MRLRPVFFTALAAEDLDQIEDYIAARDPAAAARVRKAIVQQGIQLGNARQKGMVLTDHDDEREADGRLWPVSRYRSYLILYKIDPERIRVLRILQAAQDWIRFFGKKA
jgi:plasmid stabilization system protein ParE